LQQDGNPGGGALDLTRRHERLGRRTALVSLLTLVSRILGFVREIISAALFGDQSAIYDAFITAWRVPNLFRRFLGEGALSTSLQTAMTEAEGTHGEAAGAALFQRTFVVVAGLLLLLCLGVVLVVPHLPDRMPYTGWTWLGADPQPVRELVTHLMPFVVFICLSALAAGALHVRGIFGPSAIAPVVLNTVWITSLLLVAARFGWSDAGDDLMSSSLSTGPQRELSMVHMLAWGVLLAGLLQFMVQVPAMRRCGLLRRTARGARPEGQGSAGSVLRRSAPLAFGAAVYQINVMLDGLMAEAMLPNGAPTVHYLANRVQQFPLALIAIAATSAVFPALQALGHKGDRAGVRSLHDRTHRSIAFVAIPATVGLFALAEPVISVAFERGAFGSDGVTRTSGALRMLTLAILPAGAAGLVARTYYSLGDFRTPVRVSSVMLILNVVLNYSSIRFLGMDVDGLALATAITSWASLIALWPGLTGRLNLPAGEGGHVGVLLRTLLAAGVSGLAAWATERAITPNLGDVAGLCISIAVGVMSFWGAAHVLAVPEATLLARRFQRRRG
jgi:putative peptidoglycan lipid II flippase